MHDIDKLSKEIEGLQYDLNKIVGSNTWKELMRIIHFPGWTTPAEFQLVLIAVEHMRVEVRAMETFGTNLLEASKKVGAKEQKTQFGA